MGNENEKIVKHAEKELTGLAVRDIYRELGWDWYFSPTGERGTIKNGEFIPIPKP